MLMLLFDIPFASAWASAYSGRTTCGLALGGWEVAEGMEAGRGGLSAIAWKLVVGCEYTRPAWTQAEMSC